MTINEGCLCRGPVPRQRGVLPKPLLHLVVENGEDIPAILLLGSRRGLIKEERPRVMEQ